MAKKTESEAPDSETLKDWRETGLRIRAIRELSGLTQTEMCAVVGGVDQAQWSRWERGDRPVDHPVMKRFVNRAQTSLDVVYRGVLIGTHEALARLLLAKIPHLLVPDPTRTDQDMDTDLASYRSAIRQELDSKN